jgi:hypothetical protein
LSVEIMLGGTGAADNRNLTHTVTQVRRIVPKTRVDGREDSLELEGADGAKTILIFKTPPEFPETALVNDHPQWSLGVSRLPPTLKIILARFS